MPADSNTDPSSDDFIPIPSPPINTPKTARLVDATNAIAKKRKEAADRAKKSNLASEKTFIYNIKEPQRRLSLPLDYKFRTTPTGYPIFRDLTREAPRTPMAFAQSFEDPRIQDFIHHWTNIYTRVGNHPLGRSDGFFQLQLACEVRGLVTYGTRASLVVRLVDRALRDAARGWSEIRDTVGVIKLDAPPAMPEAVTTESEEWSEEEFDDDLPLSDEDSDL